MNLALLVANAMLAVGIAILVWWFKPWRLR
jgi:NADH:ubiquinone oxidoreductase subunit K